MNDDRDSAPRGEPVNTYWVRFSQTEYRTTTVDAPDEATAREMVLSGDYYDSSFDMAEGCDIVSVEELE